MQGLRRSQRALMGCSDRLEASVGAGGKDERNECQEHGEGGVHNQTQRGTPVDHRFKL